MESSNAATKLNAKQFTQYLRDYGVTVDFNNLNKTISSYFLVTAYFYV